MNKKTINERVCVSSSIQKKLKTMRLELGTFC